MAGYCLTACLLLGCGAGAAQRIAASAPPSAAVVATIPVESFGTGVAITPDGSRAYVAASGGIFAIDTRTRGVVAKIDTGNVPYAIAMAPDGRRAYAVDLLEQQAWILDLTTDQVAKRVWVGEPRTPVLRPGIAVSADGASAYFTVSQPEQQGPGDSVRVLDTASGEIRQRGLDFHPGAIAAGAAGGSVVVVGCHGFCSDGTLHVIDAALSKPLAEVGLPSVPGGLALSPDGTRAWVANGLAGSVSVVDLARRSVVATVPVPAEPLGVAVRPDGSLVYVTSFQGTALTAIDARSSRVVASADVGPTPRAIAITPDGRFAYVTHSNPVVSVIDLARLRPGSTP